MFAFVSPLRYNSSMKQTLTAKLKILPDQEDRQLLIDTMHAYTAACDFVSSHVFLFHDLSLSSLNRELYRTIRGRFGLRAQMAQSVLRTVVAGYKAVLSSQHHWIRIRFNKPQMDLVWNRDYSLNRDRTLFSVGTLQGRIKVPFLAKGVDIDGRFGTAKLVYKHGRFFLHVPVTKELDEISAADVTNVVGIDRGIRFLAAAYDSEGRSTFFSGSAVKQKRAHYKALRRELQQVKTPSSRRRLKAIGQRENRFVRDVDHCISKALAENNPSARPPNVSVSGTGMSLSPGPIMTCSRSWSTRPLRIVSPLSQSIRPTPPRPARSAGMCPAVTATRRTISSAANTADTHPMTTGSAP